MEKILCDLECINQIVCGLDEEKRCTFMENNGATLDNIERGVQELRNKIKETNISSREVTTIISNNKRDVDVMVALFPHYWELVRTCSDS